MKLHFYKIFLVVPLLLFSQNLSAQNDCRWTGNTDLDFNKTTNWEYYDDLSSNYQNPSAISNSYSFTLDNSSANVYLSANTTIDNLTIDNGQLDFNGKSLSINRLSLNNSVTVDTSIAGSKIIYTNAWAEIMFFGFTNFNLTNFFYPEGATKPKFFSIQKAKITLTQPTTITYFRFLTSSSLKGYVDLNGYSLTINNYSVNTDNTGYIIPNINSDLILNLDNNTSNLRFANSSNSTITSGIQLKSIQKTGSYTASLYGDIQIAEKLSCTVGTIAITGSITLLSDATQTAYVGESAGTITATGGFNVQQYIPGRRVFRFLAHPFSSAIALSQLTDDIDITGTGGTSNGFTATINNNPSAYYFDVASANNTSSGLNPGWTDFANTTSNSWAKASPALIYIRGAKGEGIDGNAYTPSAVTLDMSGSINTGTQTITLTKGSNSTFVTVGNPYPSPIQMQSITSAKRSNVSSTYWVFDANLGANGGYVSKLWDTDSYVLPAYAGFATEVSATGSITFEESHKTTATPDDIFLGGNNLSDLVLNVFVNDRLYDLTRLITHDQAQSDKDYFDGGKMENADINFFTLSKNGEQLSIDARPFDLNTERIAMGLFSSSNRNIKIQADPSAFLNEHSVTLIDHYTNKQYNLNEGASVELSIDLNQSKSYGTERLELVIGQLQSHTEKLNQAKVHVYPNPSQSSNAINVQANSPIQHIAVMDVSGRLVWETSPENKSEFMEIPKTALANAGIYFIEITTALGTSSQKHVVQN